VLVVHHGGEFVDFHHNGYNGTETVLECEPNYWAYFSILSTLKRLGYPMIRSLWYHDPNLVDDLIRLRSDIGCRRMMHIAEFYGRVHLYVEHTVGDQPVMGELNPLIEYPIENMGGNVGGNVGVQVEEVFEEEGNEGINVEEYFEEGVPNVEADIAENEGINAVENEGNAVEGEVEYGTNDDRNVGPTLVDERGNLRENMGPTVLEESEHVGTTVEGEGIFNGPTTLNMGSNEVGPSGVGNDFGPTDFGLHAEYRDDYVDELGEEREDSALNTDFGDSEEEVCVDDGFGDAVGQEERVFDEWRPEAEVAAAEVAADVRSEREVAEQGSEAVAEARQGAESRSKKKGKEVSGSKPKKKRGRPPKETTKS
jgi:hypothetical protein